MVLTRGHVGVGQKTQLIRSFDVQTHECVIEVLDRGRDKVPDLLIHQTVLRLAVYNVFTGGTSTKTPREVCLTRTCVGKETMLFSVRQ